MSRGDAIREVIVAGGGIVAWSAAAALKKRIPSLNVTVASCPVAADALADRMMATLPSIGGFHQDIGLTEEDTVVRAQSALRIGTLFDGWSAGLPPYVHAYGAYSAAAGGAAFHLLWARAHQLGIAEAFDRFSAAAELARLGRIGAAVSDAANAPQIGYGLHLTVSRYRELMRDYGLHLGANERPCSAIDVTLRAEDGFIEAVLADGEPLPADLFVDCTGPAALLRSRLDDRFSDWSRWLPCDRVAFTDGPAEPQVELLDRAEAFASGWRWSASSAAQCSRGFAFSSAHSSDDRLLESLGGKDPGVVDIRQGCRGEPWLRNCVAIGDSAVAVEPLEWTNLHLAHSQIDRMISMMPGRDCAPVELAEYNRQCGAEAERVRDFICMHYITARRDEPFWKEAALIEPPESLAHTLSLFAERGRLPFYEEETFARDSWLAVLLGQGFAPRRIDPLAETLPAAVLNQELERQAEAARSFVAVQPGYGDFMSTLHQRMFR
jgi:tryptophan halogenase